MVLLAAMLWGTTGTAQTLAPAGLPAHWVGALRLLLSDQHTPIRALVTSSLHAGQPGIDAGTALDLIHIGLQQLHADLTIDASGRGSRSTACRPVPFRPVLRKEA